MSCNIISISILIFFLLDPSHETPILPNQPTTTLPFNLITTNEVHQCEISELHHRTLPFEHVHSIESDASRDCVTGKFIIST